MPNVIITGGSGTIGMAIAQTLVEKNFQVIVFTRDVTKNGVRIKGIQFAHWNVLDGVIDLALLASADYIIHLAGAGVADKRWTRKRKKEIQASRVDAGLFLVQAILGLPQNQLKAFIAASAIGWYGADPQIPNPQPFTETTPPASDFLGTTCQLWEQSTHLLQSLPCRLVYLRTGIVLNKGRGALKEFMKPLQFNIAAIMGSGHQIMSWIHIDDLVNIYVAAIENEKLNGVYNAVTAYPVSNRVFTLALAKEMHGNRFLTLPVPTWMLKIRLGEMSVEVLKSTTVSAQKLIGCGFHFQFDQPTLAIKDLLAPNG